jgi:hypothetical protein
MKDKLTELKKELVAQSVKIELHYRYHTDSHEAWKETGWVQAQAIKMMLRKLIPDEAEGFMKDFYRSSHSEIGKAVDALHNYGRDNYGRD